MNINIALGDLSEQPPAWLIAGIGAHDLSIIEASSNPRRKRELLWSRGLKTKLTAQILESAAVGVRPKAHSPTAPLAVSITHDRHFVAVALSQHGNIGIDLQTDHPLQSCRRIAETWFPGMEASEILASKNCARFLRSWVVKESWAKYGDRSIFNACGAIGVWRGQVHIIGDAPEIPHFACAWQYLDSTPQSKKLPGAGFAMGVCVSGKTSSVPTIRCFSPGPNAELCRFTADWEWPPVTVSGTKAHDT